MRQREACHAGTEHDRALKAASHRRRSSALTGTCALPERGKTPFHGSARKQGLPPTQPPKLQEAQARTVDASVNSTATTPRFAEPIIYFLCLGMRLRKR